MPAFPGWLIQSRRELRSGHCTAPSPGNTAPAIRARAVSYAILQYPKSVTLDQCSLAARAKSVLVFSYSPGKVARINVIQSRAVTNLARPNQGFDRCIVGTSHLV